MSEPVDINTLTDTASPVSLRWFGTKAYDNKQANPNQPLEAILLCSSCDNLDYRCYNGGNCNNGSCECLFGTYGRQCQVYPVCESFSAQLGTELGTILNDFSELSSFLSDFSGVYCAVSGEAFASSRSFETYRPVYVLRKKGKYAMFAYCEIERSWTLSSFLKSDGRDQNPCGKWIAKSVSTHSYDIKSVARWVIHDRWIIKDKEGEDIVPLPSFSLSCIQEDDISC